MPKQVYRVLLDGQPFDETTAVSADQATNNIAFRRFPAYNRREMRARMDAFPLRLASRLPRTRKPLDIARLFPDACPVCRGNKLVLGEICPECYGLGQAILVPVPLGQEALLP